MGFDLICFYFRKWTFHKAQTSTFSLCEQAKCESSFHSCCIHWGDAARRNRNNNLFDVEFVNVCVENGCRARLERIVQLKRKKGNSWNWNDFSSTHNATYRTYSFFVGIFVSTQIFGRALLDDAQIDIRARTKIVEYTGRNGIAHQFLAFFFAQIRFPAWFKHWHSGQTTRSHCRVRQFIGRTVRMNRIDMWTRNINTAQHKCGAHMALITEQHSLQ